MRETAIQEELQERDAARETSQERDSDTREATLGRTV
jgi:hypothetical protein